MAADMHGNRKTKKKGTVIMGMSASQARFLSLTARKTNVEYEGQQINQQRTTLSNESSNYYSQLTSMAVPVPPSTADYTKVTYNFSDGTEKNTVTSIVATKDTKSTGVYMLNYVQEIPANNMIVDGTNIVTRTGPGTTESPYEYNIGTVELQNAINLIYTDKDNNTVTKTKGIKIVENEASINDDDEENAYYTIDELRKRFKLAGIPEEIVVSYSTDELKNKLVVENQYRSMATEKYATDGWKVRYVRNSATGSYDAVLYSNKELANCDYNEKTGASLSGIKVYAFGETTESREIKNAHAKVEQDSTGRYIALFIYDDYEKDPNSGTRYELTTTTESDDAAYNDAMNQYYYDKAQYDQQVQEVNAKIEMIQVQDKNLELKLKQLDTEQNAISTEMDAVKKVISKNVESSFKTFNA